MSLPAGSPEPAGDRAVRQASGCRLPGPPSGRSPGGKIPPEASFLSPGPFVVGDPE